MTWFVAIQRETGRALSMGTVLTQPDETHAQAVERLREG